MNTHTHDVTKKRGGKKQWWIYTSPSTRMTADVTFLRSVGTAEEVPKNVK
jgi:hypothetical protein